MKRQIKFRGKRVDTGEWVIGCLVGYHQAYYDGNSNRVCIDSGILTTTEVISDTVGQFTGLLDKNGKEIYEGDISQDKLGRISICEFHHGGYWVRTIETSYSERLHSDSQIEVIGSVHDNPELLKGGKECKY